MTAHGILLLHFTSQQARNPPGAVIAAIDHSLAAGRARPRLPIKALAAAA